MGVRYALGIDIGGSSTKLGLVDESGALSAFRRIPTVTHGDPAPYLAALVAAARETAAQVPAAQSPAAQAPEPLVGVGVAVLGLLNAERTGAYASANAPALVGVNLHAALTQALGLPVLLNNDLTAHALAESAFGCGRGVRRFMTLAVGTGIGAGVIIEGRPLRLVGGAGGDTGRVILDAGSAARCGLAVPGSAEALCGAPGIERLAREQYGRAVSVADVINAARAGSDPLACAVMQTVGAYLGQTLANLSFIFFPDRVALTGGIAAAGPVLLEACRLRFEELAGEYHRRLQAMAPEVHAGVEIVLGEMRGETGVVGAAVEVLQNRVH